MGIHLMGAYYRGKNEFKKEANLLSQNFYTGLILRVLRYVDMLNYGITLNGKKEKALIMCIKALLMYVL